MPTYKIGQLIAMPWDRTQWMFGVIIRYRSHMSEQFYYDVYWMAPDGTHKTLRSYSEREITMFDNCLNNAKAGLQPDTRAYRSYIEEYLGL